MLLTPVTFFKPSSGSYHADAQDFFDRADTNGGTLTTAEKAAVDTWFRAWDVSTYKSNLIKVFLCVGDMAAQLVPAIDTISSGNATGINTVSSDFNSTGMHGDGISKAIDFKIKPSEFGSLNDVAVSFYSQSNWSANGYDYGATQSASAVLSSAYYPNTFYSEMRSRYGGGLHTFTYTGTKLGLFIRQKDGSTHSAFHRNSNGFSTLNTKVGTGGSISSRALYGMCTNEVGTPAAHVARSYSLWCFSTAFTSAEAQAFATDIQTLQADLGRDQ